jgi:hypothetical protein
MLPIFRKKAERVYYPNLYTQLANMPTCFDLRQASDDQLVLLFGNTTRLAHGLLAEMKTRDMGVDVIFGGAKR